MTRPWLVLAFFCTALLAGCGVDVVPLDARSTRLVVDDAIVSNESPMLVLIVADDGPSRWAADLRRRLVRGLRANLLRIVEGRWGPCGSRDPARWHSGDIRFVVARPSAPDAETLLTSVDLPDLAWVTKTSLPEEVDSVVAALEEALERRIAAPDEPYRPLRASRRALDLILGRRDAVGAAERTFVASLPEEFETEVLIFGTRDDEDSPAVEQLLPLTSGLPVQLQVMAPAESEYGCSPSALDAPRLQAWADLAHPRRLGWPCGDEEVWSFLVGGWSIECYSGCASAPVLVGDDGSAACRVFIDHQDSNGCPAELGWRDPNGRESYVKREYGWYRRCEVMQLAGAHLESCRHSLECPGCPSGFCVTELIEELWPSAHCHGDREPWPFRFVGGALDVDRARLHVRCMTERP